MQVVQPLVSIVTAATAVAAVSVAWRGLRTWQRQLQGTAEYELARRVLRAVLEMRTQIAAVRNPGIWPAEIERAKKERPLAAGETAEENTQQLAYAHRWSELVKARSQLSLELLEAEVLWGESIRAPEKLLDSCVRDLWLGVHRHLREASGQRVPNETEEQWLQRQAVLYEDNPETNHFSQRVKDVVAAFEKVLRPHIGARHNRSGTRSA
jgi:hypothetical protein